MMNEMEVPGIEGLERVCVNEGSLSERWEWRIKGTFIYHHPTEPSIKYTYREDWAWFWMSEEHRWDGPSAYWGGEYEYCVHGQLFTKEEWEKHPERLEWLRTQAERI